MSPAPQLQTNFTLENFATVAESLPDLWLELIDGKIEIVPPPDNLHIKLSRHLNHLLSRYAAEIEATGCEAATACCYFQVPAELRRRRGKGEAAPSNVCPDASISYTDYPDTARRPPALLVVEVLSVSNREHINRDLVTKLEIFAALEIPNYWVIDRRDQSVRAYRQPRNGTYQASAVFQADEVLPADGLEFLQITPAQIFAV